METRPAVLILALALLAGWVAVTLLRRTPLPVLSKVLIGGGLALLALAAGGLTWMRHTPRQVAVMVDLSPSTRGAVFRNRSELDQRIRQLLGDTPYRPFLFANSCRPAVPAAPLAEMPAEQTLFEPPAGAVAVVLFSDGQFSLPASAPPTYIVMDPALERPGDGAVERLETRGRVLAATVHNSAAGARQLLLRSSGVQPTTEPVPPGPLVVTEALADRASSAAAELSAGDLWPENDSLSIAIPPPLHRERWWITTTASAAAPTGPWRSVPPDQLPLDSTAYLAPAVILLDNIPAVALSASAQPLLQQYVRDLGGSLVILGGGQAFAAGGYPGTVLEDLSPLASSPPQPAMHWALLADSSGSMAGQVQTATRWQLAADAMLRFLPHLPADDLVSVGSFADRLNWWSHGRSARQTLSLALPPAEIAPRGPTNLQPALEQVAADSDGSMPTQLLVLSDAETQLDRPAALADLLKQKRIALHVLAISQGSGLPALRQLAADTGGMLLPQPDPQQWTSAVAELMRPALPRRLSEAPVAVRFSLPGMPERTATPWNRTWIKAGATLLADAEVAEGQRLVMVARWQVGSGQVIAAAFAAGRPEAEALAEQIAQAPRDPRFSVTWDAGPRLRVKVDAADGNGYLNGLDLRLEMTGPLPGAPLTYAIPQTAPSQYELSLPAPRQPALAAIHDDTGHRVIDRTALPGRYAPEFDAIGNDHAAMEALAARSGGQVVPPEQVTPIDFHWPVEPVSLRSPLAALGALLMAAGLVRWRMS